jgi:hypothetical protein
VSEKFDEFTARKELLIMRAQLQRMELGGDIQQLKREFAWMGSFGRIAEALSINKLGAWGTLGGQFLKAGLRRYPRLGFVASALLYRFRGPLAKTTLKAGLAASVFVGVTRWLKRNKHNAPSS